MKKISKIFLVLCLAAGAVIAVRPQLRAEGCKTETYELMQNLTGASCTSLMMIQNLSVYDMELDTYSKSMGDQICINPFLEVLCRDPRVSATRVMAINGIPQRLPASKYVEGKKNSIASPMIPVIWTWQDATCGRETEYVKDFFISYKMKNVKWYDKDVVKYGDTNLTISLKRCEPPKPDPGDLGLVWAIFKEIISILDVIIDPANPLGWIGLVCDTIDLVKDIAFSEHNTHSSEWRFKVTAFARCAKEGHFPGGIKGKNDSLTLTSTAICKDASQGIVTQIMTFRKKWEDEDGTGKLPYTLVTVVDLDHYQAASMGVALRQAAADGSFKDDPAIQKLQAHMEKKGKKYWVGFIKAFQRLSAEQREELLNSVSPIYSAKELDRGKQSAIKAYADLLPN